MIRGFGASRAGMATEQIRSDVIANNVANVNSDGFKRSVAVAREFGTVLLRRLGDKQEEGPIVGRLGNGAEVDQVVKQTNVEGTLRETGNPLDLALLGPGEFTVQGPDGPEYTRDGRFQRDADGRLVTAKGYLVLAGGAPVGAGARNLLIGQDGTVMADGQPAERLDIQGGNGTKLAVGSLEAAGVDISLEMSDLIVAMRSYQVNQRALQMQDQTLAKAVTELANP